jgi:hypothetical protein
MKRDGEGRNPEPLEAPEAPNPGGGPFPHYKRGGRRKQKDGGRSEGGRSHRRMDRPKRQMGGMMPAPQVPLAQMPPAQLSPAALAQLRAAGMGPRPGMPMGQKRGGRTKNFHPGGEKGKLHREMGIPEGEKIPKDKLAAATHSSDPEKRRDAIRAETMSHWRKG